MQLDALNNVTDILETLKEILNLEDAYYVNDVIIKNIYDPEMPVLVQEILDLNGYSNEIMKKVLSKVIEIQKIVSSE